MKKAVFLIIAVLVLTLAAGAFAAGVNGDYKGNPIARVILNGKELVFPDVPAFGYDGRTLMPLRACVESVNGIVEWDNQTQTATILKPSVSVFFYTLNEDESIEDAYSFIPVIEQGREFYSCVDISGIPAGTYTVKAQVVNQSGTVIAETDDNEVVVQKDNDMINFFTKWDYIQLLQETYYFNVLMKDSSGAYKTVEVKTMRYE